MNNDRIHHHQTAEPPGPRRLAFNIEPTFRCNLSCPMCPRLSSTDLHLDMSLETFERIAANFAFAHTVDFTGWGEPLMNKNVYHMIATARRHGCGATCTSNGTALNEENARRLIESGLNVLTVSIDGISRSVYEHVRVGADFEAVTNNLRRFSRLLHTGKRDASGPRTSLCVAFTIQESNWEQLRGLVDWVEKVGAGLIHLKHLNVISTPEDLKNSLLKYGLEEPGHESCWRQPERLKRAEELMGLVCEEAAKRGIGALVHSEYPLTDEMRPRHCLAAPLDAVYFSYDGMVSPCCHFGHTVSRFFQGKYEAPRALFYGDIRRQEFQEVWNSPAFVAFRRGFLDADYPEACRSCYLLYGK